MVIEVHSKGFVYTEPSVIFRQRTKNPKRTEILLFAKRGLPTRDDRYVIEISSARFLDCWKSAPSHECGGSIAKKPKSDWPLSKEYQEVEEMLVNSSDPIPLPAIRWIPHSGSVDINTGRNLVVWLIHNTEYFLAECSGRSLKSILGAMPVATRPVCIKTLAHGIDWRRYKSLEPLSAHSPSLVSSTAALR